MGPPAVFGLRTRLVLALLLTAAVSLLTAAIALFEPLEQRLRRSEVNTLIVAAATARPSFEELKRAELNRDPRLPGLVQTLAHRTGARVAFVEDDGIAVFDTDPDVPQPIATTSGALAQGHLLEKRLSTREELIVLPLRISGKRYGLVLTKQLSDVSAA